MTETNRRELFFIDVQNDYLGSNQLIEYPPIDQPGSPETATEKKGA